MTTPHHTQMALLCEGIAETIETYGHITGGYGYEEVGFCLVGAGIKTLGGPEGVETLFPISQALGLRTPGSVIKLNDGNIHAGIPPLDKDSAVKLATDRAKFWRNQ